MIEAVISEPSVSRTATTEDGTSSGSHVKSLELKFEAHPDRTLTLLLFKDVTNCK